jgi:hypothetical protein
VGRNLETVLLGFGLLVVVGLGAGAYGLWQRPGARMLVSAAYDTATLAIESNSSPTGQALRQAGCHSTMIGEWGRIRAFAGLRQDRASPVADDTPLVFCRRRFDATGPDCQEAHAAYVANVDGPPPRLGVMIREGAKPVACSGFYGPDGTRLGDFPPARSAKRTSPPATCPPAAEDTASDTAGSGYRGFYRADEARPDG